MHCKTRVVAAPGRDRIGARPICSQCRSAATEGVRPLARSLAHGKGDCWLAAASAADPGVCPWAGGLRRKRAVPYAQCSCRHGGGGGGGGGGWGIQIRTERAGAAAGAAAANLAGPARTHALLYGSSTTPLYPPTAHPAAAACHRRLPPPATAACHRQHPPAPPRSRTGWGLPRSCRPPLSRWQHTRRAAASPARPAAGAEQGVGEWVGWVWVGELVGEARF